MTSKREETRPLGFSTLTPLPGLNVGELPPITVSTLTANFPKNTPRTNRASTYVNPDPMISLAFVDANYEVICPAVYQIYSSEILVDPRISGFPEGVYLFHHRDFLEDWESDSEDENVFEPKEVKKIVKPSLEKIEFVYARNATFENENKAEKLRSSVRVLGGKITGPKKIRPVWDNIARVNHQNKLTHPHPKRNFVPAAVLTNSGQVPVNAAKQSSHKAASVSAARHVNTAASRPNMNNALIITYSYFKAHLLVRRPFNKKSADKTNNFNEKVNTAKVNNVTTAGPKAVVSAAKGNWNNVVKSSTC
nr:reverse transcriptase domain-containing protein [Tanacetum cinerariifolium]